MCATQTSILPGPCKPLSLPLERRPLRSSEFREIYQTGFRMSCRYFAVFCLRRTGEPNRVPQVGFTLPRAIGKAVVRNRIRRRMREAVRLQFDRLAPDWALVFNPRRTVLDASFEELCRETGRIIEKCNGRS